MIHVIRLYAIAIFHCLFYMFGTCTGIHILVIHQWHLQNFQFSLCIFFFFFAETLLIVKLILLS